MRFTLGVCVLMISLTAGCGDEGSGAVFGSLTIPNCDGKESKAFTCDAGQTPCKAFDLAPDFFAMDVVGDQVFIRVQRSSYNPPDIDGVYIQLKDKADVALDMSMPVADDAGVRVGLHLGETCPDGDQSLGFTGGLVLTHFGTDKGDRIAGSLDPLTVIDRRTGETVGELTVRFDFEFNQGAPYQPYARD